MDGIFETALIVIHLLVVLALIAMVLLQRSEGGALGMGGGGGGGFMTNRGATNVLTRTTAILATVFFATSIILTILARVESPSSSILDNVEQQQLNNEGTGGANAPAPDGTGGGILDILREQSGETTSGPQIPSSE